MLVSEETFDESKTKLATTMNGSGMAIVLIAAHEVTKVEGISTLLLNFFYRKMFLR